jgi:hypothetical protein
VWYNCAQVTLWPSDSNQDFTSRAYFIVQMNELTVGTPLSASIAESEVNYYKTALSADEFLYIKAKAPSTGSLTVAIKR